MTYPPWPTDPFYAQFHDPLRAYSNLPTLERFYRETPAHTPPATAEDFVRFAWAQAHAHAEEETHGRE